MTSGRNGRRGGPDAPDVSADLTTGRGAGPLRAPAVAAIALLGVAAALLIAVSFLVSGVPVNQPASGGTTHVTPTLITTSSPLGQP
jgi:hypothetical protein